MRYPAQKEQYEDEKLLDKADFVVRAITHEHNCPTDTRLFESGETSEFFCRERAAA
jgi:hypothetical protein